MISKVSLTCFDKLEKLQLPQGATGAPEEDAADVHQQERERLQLLMV